MFVVVLAPFGATGDQVNAACPPGAPGEGQEPEAKGPLRASQIAYARIIDQVAVQRGLPGQATLIALMTALVESNLQNLSYGDADSVGLFQQRPGAGWGTPGDIMNPTYAANAFFGGSDPPSPPGLVDINGWPSMNLGDAAQAVQVSAFPDRYALREQQARQIAALARIDLNRAGDPYAGRSGGDADGAISTPTPAQPGGDCGGGLTDGKPTAGNWPPEDQTVPDPTGTGGMLTPRTAAWVAAARTALQNPSMSCWDAHVWNPTSDHPKGRACDVFVGGDGRKKAAARADGDRYANWTVQTAGQTGVRYVIWYGKIWSARTGQWRPYNGGGVYDPSSASGGHFDHVHVSIY
ncbi:hypothetical protein [Kribbella shirazensis]|uniref:ARB-07466-like C-terminal domain-containing protein n=1 Tax=Kribbella shirazensis TaxID=1105143 RepID=A0A7X5VGU6_9ACTN|nr:hypothetical protein [Kribbella shirazensis]NIK60824.1 hypothetical protein [Kribbella shirazensis]